MSMSIENTRRSFGILSYLAVLVFLAVCLTLIFGRDSGVIGCSEAPPIIYDEITHALLVLLYVVAHTYVGWELALADRPFDESQSVRGNVSLLVSRFKIGFFVRAFLLTLWLVLFFYTNAENGDFPAVIMGLHFTVVFVEFLQTILSVKRDNLTLGPLEQIKFDWWFFYAYSCELICSLIWFTINVFDLHVCHSG